MKSLIKTIPLVLIFCMSVISVLSILAEFSASGVSLSDNYDRDKNGLISQQKFIQVKSDRITPIGSQGRF